MNYYKIVATTGVLCLSPLLPRTKKHDKFVKLWQQKKYEEALNFFPDDWLWFTEDRSKEVVTDMPGNMFTGITFSKKAFDIMYPVFHQDMLFHHDLFIEDHHFVWVHIPIVEKKDIASTNHHLFITRPSYKTYASEVFYDFFKRQGFTGEAFILIK